MRPSLLTPKAQAMPALLLIESEDFVAGIIPRDMAAPPLAWMIDKRWSEEQIRRYCEARGWLVITVH